jgi:hypothetical protein
MTTKTRYFMLGSFAVLVAGLCTGLVAYYGGLPTGAFGQKPGPAELVYVPPDAAVVAFADVQEVMGSELRRRVSQMMPPGEANGREEFQRQTGIDIERDIDHVVACMVTRSAEGREWDSGFVVFRGRFDTVRLESLAQGHGATVEEYKGKRLIRLPAHRFHGEKDASAAAPEHAEPGQRHGHPDMTLAFVEPGLVMFGDQRSVRRAIDTAASGRDITGNADMLRLVKDVDSTSNAWAVGRFDVIANRAKLPEGISSQIPPVKWFAAAARVNGGVSGTFTAEARDEEAARNLPDVANGFLALARMQAGSRPELQGMIQSLQLSGVGNKVELSFSLPTELFDAIAGAAKARQPAD